MSRVTIYRRLVNLVPTLIPRHPNATLFISGQIEAGCRVDGLQSPFLRLNMEVKLELLKT